MNTRTLPLICACLLATACSSPRTGSEINLELERAMDYCEARLNANEPMEAFRLYEAVRSVDPEYPGVEAVGDAFRTQYEDLSQYFDREWLGSNHALRMPDEAGVLGQILLYLPDRILDLFDVFSFDVHVGVGAYADVHVTRMVQAAAGARVVTGVGWHDHRSLGMLNQADSALAILAFGGRGYAASVVGSSGVITGSWTEGPIHQPSDDIYADFLDYWAVGADVTAAVVGVSADIHPIEIFDFLVGWATFDPANDDFAHTRGSRLLGPENKVIGSLGRVSRDEDELQSYRTWRTSHPVSQEDNPEIEG